MASLADFIRSKRKNKEQAKSQESEKRARDFIKWIPFVALGIGNLIVLAGELRVFDVVYRLTNSLLLAATALLGTGMLFILWFDVLHQYRLKSETQSKISLVFSITSLLMGGFFAFADYVVDVPSQTVLGFGIEWLWGSIVVVTVANAVALFWWHEIDRGVAFSRQSAEIEAEDEHEQKEYDGFEKSLARRASLLDRHQDLIGKYGDEALSETIEEHNASKGKQQKQKQNQPKPQQAYASDAQQVKPDPTTANRPNGSK